ncbi:MAG: PLP-dependent aminotransferase family protein [Pseudomonadales bacterium]|nr:PLP-dependent aminotransferase family protein [Pseudomonadales bacterium]
MITDLQIDSTLPLQQQLYRQLSQRILQRRYPAGSRLPSSRQLAQDLGVSRNTVNAVYDQLRSEGFLQTQAGRGIFVHQDIDSRHCPPTKGASPQPERVAIPPLPALPEGAIRRSDQDSNLPFTPGLPDLAAFPIRAWNRILHHHESRPSLMGYNSLQGYRPLRRAVAEYVGSARGVRCHEDQVIITQGAQQALALIADIFLKPGDRVLCEDPGYRGARYALGRHGNPLIPVPLRHQVLDIDVLADAGPARLLYCTPTHQYPMGGILDASQRMALVEWAQRNQTWIIEDDYDSDFHFYTKPFAAIQGMFDQAPVLYMGSFSKTLMPALRVGYLIVPDTLVEHVLRAKRVMGGETALLTQAVIAEFIDSGQFTRHLRRMRQNYREKWEQFQGLVIDQLSGLAAPIAESAGMHLVLTGDWPDRDCNHWLWQQGYGSTPLSAHYLGPAQQQGLVMGFASASDQQIRDCVAALAMGLARAEQRKT